MAKLYSKEESRSKAESKEVGLWMERIDLGKKELERFAEDSGANRFVKEYRGDFGLVFQGRTRKIPVPPINEVFAYVQADIATTYNRDPYITVNATAGTPKGAALWETIVNYWWRKLNSKEELEYEILDKDLIGYAWHKVGHNVSSIGKDDALEIKEERLFSNWVNWRDVIWNIGAKRPPHDCQWIAQRIVMPLEKIKKLYPNAKGLEGCVNPDVKEDTFKKTTYKDDIKVGILWEIWDAENRKVRLLAEGLKDKYLAPVKDWPEFLNKFPLTMYWDFLVPGRSQPMSAIAPWEAQLLEEMILLGQSINHSKRWNRQLFYNGAEIDENAMDKFERGDDGAMIRVNGKLGSEDLRFADFGQLPTDFYLLMDRLKQLRVSISGQPDFVRGGITKTGTRTVGELNLLSQGNKGLQARKIDRLETHCENIVKLMVAYLKANFDFQETIKVTGDTPEEIILALGENYDPVTQTVTFTPSEIEGEYDFDVKSGSTLPLDKQNRSQVLEIVLQTVAAAVSQAPMSPFLNTLIMEILKDYDIKGLEEAYKLEVMQAEQQKQAESEAQGIEEQKIQAESAKRAAQSQKIQIETEIASQEAALGPVGRTQLERLKKDPLTPKGVIIR